MEYFNGTMTGFHRRLLIVLYAVAAAFFFIFLLFPAESVKKGITARVEKMFPPHLIRIETLSLCFPPGIRLTGVTVLEGPDPLINLSKVIIIPRWLELLTGQTAFRLKGTAYEGGFSGDIKFKKSMQAPLEEGTLNITDVNLNSVPIKALEGTPELSGIVGGSMTYSQTEKGGGATAASLVFRSVTLHLPSLPALKDDMTFDTVNTAFSIEKQTVTFQKFTFSGKQIEGDITGTVRLSEAAEKSQLNLQMNIAIHPEFQDKISQLLPMIQLNQRDSGRNSYKLRVFGKLDKPGFSITR